MLRSILASASLALPMTALAAGLVLNDLKSRNAAQLSADELKRLLPGAKVISHSEGGSWRQWTNEPDGTLAAISDVHRDPGKLTKSKTARGPGTWHISDNGTYCVTLEWPHRTENWCRYMFRLDGKYYGVKSLVDGASPAQEFEFSK